MFKSILESLQEEINRRKEDDELGSLVYIKQVNINSIVAHELFLTSRSNKYITIYLTNYGLLLIREEKVWRYIVTRDKVDDLVLDDEMTPFSDVFKTVINFVFRTTDYFDYFSVPVKSSLAVRTVKGEVIIVFNPIVHWTSDGIVVRSNNNSFVSIYPPGTMLYNII